MKMRLIAPFAVVTVFLGACEQRSAQITSSSPAPSSTPAVAAADSLDSSEAPSSSLASSSPSAEASAPSSQSATSNPRPVFKSEAATQAANQYLDSYGALLNDINATPGPRNTDPQTGLNNVKAQLQKLGRDGAELRPRFESLDDEKPGLAEPISATIGGWSGHKMVSHQQAAVATPSWSRLTGLIVCTTLIYSNSR